MQIVKHPTYGDIQFPDGTSVADMEAAIAGLGAQSQQPSTQAHPVEQVQQEQQSSIYEDALSAVGRVGLTQARAAKWAGEKGATPENLVRYGIPVAAGIATAPVSAPIGVAAFLGSMATQSGVGSISSALAEAGAQKLEGKDVDWRKVGSAGVYGATPFIPSSVLGPTTRMIANAALSQGASEAAKYVETGKYEAPKSIFDFAPAVLSGAMSRAGSGASARLQTFAKKEELANQRMGGSVMLSELFSDYTDMEARQIALKNPKVISDLRNMDTGVSDAIAKHYADVPKGGDIANRLAPHIDELQGAQDAVIRARSSAKQLSEAAKSAETLGRAEAKELKEQAREAVITEMAENAKYNGMLTKFFGPGVPSLEGVAKGARMANLTRSGEAAKASADEIVSQAYKASSVNENTQVVSLKSVIQEARTIPANDARKAFVETMTKKFGEKGTMSLYSFRKLKDDIASDLAVAGMDRNAANRLAAQQYNVVRNASDKYMSKVHAERAEPFKKANATARTMFQAEQGELGVIDKIINSSSDPDGLYNLIKEHGAGKALGEIDTYTKSLSAVAGKDAADLFHTGVVSSIRDSLLDNASVRGMGHLSASRTFSPELIAKEADILAGRGFPVESLGFGNRKDIANLAKLSSVGKVGGIRPDEVETILSLVDQYGGEQTAARLMYNRKLEKALISSGQKEKERAVTEAGNLARSARITEQEAEIAFAKAKNSPIVQLLNGTAMGISKDPAANAKWANTVLSLDGSTLEEFKKAMVSSGQGKTFYDLGLAAEASVISKFHQATSIKTPKVDADKLMDFFVSPQNSIERKNLETLIGKDALNNLVEKWVKPLNEIASTQAKLSNSKKIDINGLQAAIGVRSFMKGNASSGTIAGKLFEKINDLAKTNQYNLLHTLYIDPVTSKSFERNLYDMDKFIDSSPVNAVRINLARLADEEAANAAPVEQ